MAGEALKSKISEGLENAFQLVRNFADSLKEGRFDVKAVLDNVARDSVGKDNVAKEQKLSPEQNAFSLGAPLNATSATEGSSKSKSHAADGGSSPAGADKNGTNRQGRRRRRHAEVKNEDVKIEALYVADAHKLVPKLYTFGYDFKNWNEYWTILNTGEVYLGLPSTDTRSFDYERERREHPYRFMKYQAEGKKISGLDYNGYEVSFELGQESFRADDSTVFKRVDPCTGCRLNGTYRRHEAYTDEVEEAKSGGLPGQTTFDFQEDGSFIVQGCTVNRCLVPRPHAPVVCRRVGLDPESRMRRPDADIENEFDEFDYNNEGGAGRYKISSHRIELEYDDGRTEEAFFFKYPGDDDHILSINGVNFFRQQAPRPPVSS